MSWSLWLTLFPVLLLLALSPGPNNFTAMHNGIHAGAGSAAIGAIGRNAAFAILMTISAMGLGAIIVSSLFWFSVIKWAGVLYLVYIGIKTWRSRPEMISDSTITNGVKSRRSMIYQEFLIAISNPKAILIFTAVFPQMLDLNQPVVPQFLVIGLTFMLAEFVSAWLYGLSGKQIRRAIGTVKGMERLNKVLGSLFIGAGGILAASSR